MLLRLSSIAWRFWSSSEPLRFFSSATADRYSLPIDSRTFAVSAFSRWDGALDLVVNLRHLGVVDPVAL